MKRKETDMTAILLSVFKYWRAGGVVLLALAFGGALYLAQARGDERDRLQKELREAHRQMNAAAVIHAAEKNRHEIREQQNRRLRHATNPKIDLDAALRSAYDSLRERQSTRNAR